MTNNKLPNTILYPKTDKPGVVILPRWYLSLRGAHPDEAKFIEEAKVHPEIGYMAVRAFKLIDGDLLTSQEDKQLHDAVAAVLFVGYDFRWWFLRLPENTLLPFPNRGQNLSVEELRSAVPTHDSFADYLDFVQRVWAYIERLEAKHGLTETLRDE